MFIPKSAIYLLPFFVKNRQNVKDSDVGVNDEADWHGGAGRGGRRFGCDG